MDSVIVWRVGENQPFVVSLSNHERLSFSQTIQIMTLSALLLSRFAPSE